MGPLLDSSKTLQELGVIGGAVLTDMPTPQPMGQDRFEERNGKRIAVNRQGTPVETLNEFELQSWRRAWEFDRTLNGTWNHIDLNDSPWGNIGCQIDFYWTMVLDIRCRYEYWSTDPDDKEYGILVRVDESSMRVVGDGSDD